jgi:hypothetical protein
MNHERSFVAVFFTMLMMILLIGTVKDYDVGSDRWVSCKKFHAEVTMITDYIQSENFPVSIMNVKLPVKAKQYAQMTFE